MANIKIGDNVRITKGVLFGVVCVVSDIIRGEGDCGPDLFLLCCPRSFSSSYVSAYYEEGEFKKVGSK